MKNILSIQSHVVYGYVGNRAAVFPLQRLGMNVSAINTVQFSNHTGYGAWQGDVFEKSHLESLFSGLKDLNVVQNYHALLTGYLGSPKTGEVISDILAELRLHNPDLIYCCDPVIGDVGRGVFVRPGVGEYFKNVLCEQATVLTPNEFELSYLTDLPINSLSDAKFACQKLVDSGANIVLITSVSANEIPADKIGILLYTKDSQFLAITPRFEFEIAPNGAGDATAALYLGHILRGETPEVALSKTAEALHHIFRITSDNKTRELQLIQSQDQFNQSDIKHCVLEKI